MQNVWTERIEELEERIAYLENENAILKKENMRFRTVLADLIIDIDGLSLVEDLRNG